MSAQRRLCPIMDTGVPQICRVPGAPDLPEVGRSGRPQTLIPTQSPVAGCPRSARRWQIWETTDLHAHPNPSHQSPGAPDLPEFGRSGRPQTLIPTPVTSRRVPGAPDLPEVGRSGRPQTFSSLPTTVTSHRGAPDLPEVGRSGRAQTLTLIPTPVTSHRVPQICPKLADLGEPSI
jgi:hypothetical protein